MCGTRAMKEITWVRKSTYYMANKSMGTDNVNTDFITSTEVQS